MIITDFKSKKLTNSTTAMQILNSEAGFLNTDNKNNKTLISEPLIPGCVRSWSFHLVASAMRGSVMHAASMTINGRTESRKMAARGNL